MGRSEIGMVSGNVLCLEESIVGRKMETMGGEKSPYKPIFRASKKKKV
jgi:hypothetical protein